MYWKFIAPFIIFSKDMVEQFVFIDNTDFSNKELMKVIKYFDIKKYHDKNLKAELELISLEDFNKKKSRSTIGENVRNLIEKKILDFWLKVPSTTPTNLALTDSVEAAVNNCDTSIIMSIACVNPESYIVPPLTFSLNNQDVTLGLELNMSIPAGIMGAINFGFLGYRKDGIYSSGTSWLEDGDYRYQFSNYNEYDQMLSAKYEFEISNGVVTIINFTDSPDVLHPLITMKNPFVQNIYNLGNEYKWYPFIGGSEIPGIEYYNKNYNTLYFKEVFSSYNIKGGMAGRTYSPPEIGDYSGYRMMKGINREWVEQKGYISKSGKWLKCYKTL